MADPIVGLELPKVQPRVDFAPDEFRAQIQGWGHRFRWERAMRCPCRLQYEDRYDPTLIAPSRAGDPDCSCKGTGYRYVNPQNIKALVNDASSDKKFLQAFGELAFGSVRLSMLPEHLPAWRDRLIDLDGARIYQEPPRIRAETVEQPTYPILTRSMLVGSSDDPTLAQRRNIGVTVMRKTNAAGEFLDEELVEGVDFRVTDEGAVEFLDASVGAGPPAVGEGYSLVYTCCPTYIVRSHPHLYRHTYVATKPFVNTIDGFQGEWSPVADPWPSGDTLVRGDYFEVIEEGELDDVTFAVGDHLVAAVDRPTGLAADWACLSDSYTPPAQLVPMTVLALAWLEDLGDPFNRTGTP